MTSIDSNQTEMKFWLIAGIAISAQVDAAGCTVALTASTDAPPQSAAAALVALARALIDARAQLVQEASCEL